MRNLTVLAAVLLSSSMLAATAAAQPDSESLLCSPLGQRLGVCQTIGVTDSAASGVVDLLRKDHMIVPIDQISASVFPSHLVIGAADLDNSQTIALLRRSYRVGKTVAIVNATGPQATRFHRLLRPGEPADCQPVKGQAIIPLYGLQTSRNRVPPQNSSYCLVSLDQRHPLTDRVWLFARFGLAQPQPAVGNGSASRKSPFGFAAAASDDPSPFLTGLTGAKNCSSKGSSNSQGNMQADLYVYAMRAFTDTGCGSCADPGADYYLVQENLSFSKDSSAVNAFGAFVGALTDTTSPSTLIPGGSYNLLFTDPATATTFESSYTNGSSSTASGSVGVSGDGPDVTIGGSVTTSQSQTYSVPATQILNLSSLATAEPEWTFTPQSQPNGALFQINPTWTWFIPQDSYPSHGNGSGQIQFNYYEFLLTAPNTVQADLVGTCGVNFPFTSWTVNPPQISSLTQPQGNNSTTPVGQTFTINGQYLYPSSVTAVLIGGTAVPLSTNVELVNDTTIGVTVPGSFAAGTYPVQVNTQFNGENRFSNTDVSVTLTSN